MSREAACCCCGSVSIDMLARRTRVLRIHVPPAEGSASKRKVTTAPPYAAVSTVTAVVPHHELKTKWTIIKALPAKGFANLDCLWPSLHVIHLPIRFAFGANVEPTAFFLAKKA
jgi:hypothetical protein